MSVKKNPSDFYSKKKYLIKLSKFYSKDQLLNSKLDKLQIHLSNGFTLYTSRILERFIKGHVDISDFAEQFIMLEEYYENHNKYSNSEKQYIIQYGETLGKKRWKEKINKVKGNNNPWYNHGGKYSPWKKGSVNYSEEALIKAKENRSYNTTIEYYLNKGLSETDAKEALRKRQATGSLEKQIELYGEVEGIRKWKTRQENWQNTLKSKSQEEIDDINRRKSSGIGRYLDMGIPGKLYYIHFYNDKIEFWKIGITSKSINERFNLYTLNIKTELNCDIQFINNYDTIQEAYKKEQEILAIFNNNRITIDIKNFYTTEAFSNNVLSGLYDTI